ncbi:hypothetical protein MSHOH_1304 [Methanosarcina horonobensis HB-1 = JCM 15518]|uniref:Uncharacterized protein n=1 Tax=Methanosarcina horonobensis HB-1 = JCM 15518 TaxID=1434110 RepID=A0A0E3SCS4_9EURY|nr:hypothetical protein [Methanosarcina horonobensis]AKB77787.1 hypothetical protein MSHOH_1304 [Methanosarcina horonobensis HB-1 = JCM 15518]
MINNKDTDEMTKIDKAEATKNASRENHTIRKSKRATVNVIKNLQKTVKILKKQKSSIVLVNEYENAIAVLNDRVKLTSGNFNAVISDMRETIQLEQASENPDTKKVRNYLDAIAKLESACV